MKKLLKKVQVHDVERIHNTSGLDICSKPNAQMYKDEYLPAPNKKLLNI